MNKCYHEVTAVQLLKDVDNVRELILASMKSPEDVISISFCGWKSVGDDIEASYAVFSYVIEDGVIDHVNAGTVVKVVWSFEKHTFSVV